MTAPACAKRFRLAALLAAHVREQHPHGLPEALGDGALLNRLPLLARLRYAVLKRGFAIVPADQIAGAHSMFPVLELVELLERRALPFRRTANAARFVVERDSAAGLTERLFRQICVANHLNHESAHALLYDLAVERDGRLDGSAYVDVLLVSEAFAIAVEQFVALAALADGRRTTALYLALNAYITPFDLAAGEELRSEDLMELAARALEAPDAMLKMLTAVTLLTLARPTAGRPKEELAERLADLIGVDELESSTLQWATAVGLRVDFDFRSNVQRNFYEYLGLDRAYARFVSQPLSRMYVTSASFNRDLPSAIRVLTKPA